MTRCDAAEGAARRFTAYDDRASYFIYATRRDVDCTTPVRLFNGSGPTNRAAIVSAVKLYSYRPGFASWREGNGKLVRGRNEYGHFDFEALTKCRSQLIRCGSSQKGG